jgi:hypothetical protein
MKKRKASKNERHKKERLEYIENWKMPRMIYHKQEGGTVDNYRATGRD